MGMKWAHTHIITETHARTHRKKKIRTLELADCPVLYSAVWRADWQRETKRSRLVSLTHSNAHLCLMGAHHYSTWKEAWGIRTGVWLLRCHVNKSSSPSSSQQKEMFGHSSVTVLSENLAQRFWFRVWRWKKDQDVYHEGLGVLCF